MADKRIIVIECNDKDEFMNEVNFNLKRGYEISSTNCGFVNDQAYDYCSVYQAILYRKGIKYEK